MSDVYGKLETIEAKLAELEGRVRKIEEDVAYVRGVIDTLLQHQHNCQSSPNGRRNGYVVAMKALNALGWALFAIVVLVKAVVGF